jgi:hypothetical protein
MTAKHSPGPWKFEPWGNRVLDSREGSSQLLVATVAINSYHDEGRHNARLIAAAPRLLEALQRLKKYGGIIDSVNWRVICDAINEATGEA